MDEQSNIAPIEPVDPVRAHTSVDKVAIVGFAETTRHLAPFDDLDYEIWGVNEEYVIPDVFRTKDGQPRFDRWFQLHPRWIYARWNNGADPRHFEWLKAQRPVNEGGFPIYMQQHWADIPASVALPIQDLIDYSQGGPEGTEGYYTNTIAYMIAMAVHEGFKHVEVYGVEMASGTEWAYQKPCTEYHVGIARAHGVKVIFPDGCQITRAQLYGWEVSRMIERIEFEIRADALAREEAASIARLNMAVATKIAVRKEIMESGEDPMKDQRYIDAAMGEMKAFAAANSLSGAKQESAHWINVLDQRFGPGRGPDSMPTEGLIRVPSVAAVEVDPN